jgi:4-amino-4-deoxy-L-arabinose transferase-like glycosyltransferase
VIAPPIARAGAAITLVVATVTLFAGLGGAALWNRDEAWYVLAALEMQQRGDWLMPTLMGRAWVEKPPMLYWWLRASFLALGVSEFAARLPSAAIGVATCLLTYRLAAALGSAWKSFATQIGTRTLGG